SRGCSGPVGDQIATEVEWIDRETQDSGCHLDPERRECTEQPILVEAAAYVLDALPPASRPDEGGDVHSPGVHEPLFAAAQGLELRSEDCLCILDGLGLEHRQKSAAELQEIVDLIRDLVLRKLVQCALSQQSHAKP